MCPASPADLTGVLNAGAQLRDPARFRIYRLTLAGEAALAEQSQQWSEFSGSVARVLGTPAAASPWRPAPPAVTA
jgi:hypothetical protein